MKMGKVIKVLAFVVGFLGMFGSFLIADTVCQGSANIAVGFIVGTIMTIIVSLLIYGFGDLINTNEEIREHIEQSNEMLRRIGNLIIEQNRIMREGGKKE